jgi:hypothetical protein
MITIQDTIIQISPNPMARAPRAGRLAPLIQRPALTCR